PTTPIRRRRSEPPAGSKPSERSELSAPVGLGSLGGGTARPSPPAGAPAGEAPVVAALRGLDEVDQVGDVRVAGQLGAQARQGLRGVELRFEQDLDRLLEMAN